MNIDFSNSKIYMLTNLKTNRIYIGSTTESLKTRLKKHRKYYNEWLEGKRKYTCSSSKILETGKTYIILLENYPCTSKSELLIQETKWILKYKLICVNKNMPVKYIKYHYKHTIYYKSTSIKWISSIEFID